MPLRRIPFLKSSSTHLALIFSLLLAISMALIVDDLMFHDRPQCSTEQLWNLWIKVGALAMVGLGLFAIAYYVTKRINTICSVAEDIIRSGDLSQRIPVENKWDDLSTLSHVLNSLLSETEQLMGHVRQVSDNIAHDLRHPLARLRNQLEDAQEALKHEADGQLSDRMQQLIDESDRLMATFSALLRIGNIESGNRKAHFRQIKLDSLLADIIELYEPIALDKNQRLALKIECDGEMHADKDLLFQAVVNAVENAIKYTPEGGEIRIRLWQDSTHLRICIADTGEGVADAHKENLFRRFYRVDASRSTPGTGLGLSLVLAVVKLHKGRVSLEDNDPNGLVVCMRFPLS